jgi:hypothetical protein
MSLCQHVHEFLAGGTMAKSALVKNVGRHKSRAWSDCKKRSARKGTGRESPRLVVNCASGRQTCCY